jgi:elongation factor P
MAITTNDLKNGMTLSLDDGLFQVMEFQHVKPGKGGAFVRTTLRNVRSGGVLDRTFRAGEKVDQAIVEKHDMQYLYRDPAGFVFMDTDSYEQLTVPEDTLGDAGGFLVEGANVNLAMYGTEIVGVDLPAAVELEVAETEPGIQGDRVSGARKPATLVTGLVVQVPLFVDIGDRLKIDTRSGDYITRA